MAETRIVPFSPELADGHRFAVSLHSHTRYSKEHLDFLPAWTARVPVLAGLVRAQIRQRERKTGSPLDFSRAYWRAAAGRAVHLLAVRRSHPVRPRI